MWRPSLSIIFTYRAINSFNEELCTAYYINSHYYNDESYARELKHKDLFPWTATLDIANNELQPTYPPEYSYIIIATTAIFGFIATLFYFKRVDIH